MFKVKKELEKDNFVKFIVEPLEAGFGHTVGNSLRRVMLNSLEGSAITQVKIEGVAHQFSTITGVSEDVIEILLNLKKVRIRVFSDKQIKLKLSVSGKKEIKAGDFEVIGDGEIANPDLHIATLDPKAKIVMELVAEKGKGYSVAEERKSGEIGVIPLDASFSPVVAVNYQVVPTRVGRKSDFDQLALEVTTDGTITPEEALNQAAKILSSNFKEIVEPSSDEEVVKPSAEVGVSDEVLKMTVEELDLPVRITNALRAIDINTVEDLVNVPRVQLLKAKNFGNKSLSLISENLAERGLSLREA
jgi:DNA-directed RNA polymerase subunit alpha